MRVRSRNRESIEDTRRLPAKRRRAPSVRVEEHKYLSKIILALTSNKQISNAGPPAARGSFVPSLGADVGAARPRAHDARV